MQSKIVGHSGDKSTRIGFKREVPAIFNTGRKSIQLIHDNRWTESFTRPLTSNRGPSTNRLMTSLSFSVALPIAAEFDYQPSQMNERPLFLHNGSRHSRNTYYTLVEDSGKSSRYWCQILSASPPSGQNYFRYSFETQTRQKHANSVLRDRCQQISNRKPASGYRLVTSGFSQNCFRLIYSFKIVKSRELSIKHAAQKLPIKYKNVWD